MSYAEQVQEVDFKAEANHTISLIQRLKISFEQKVKRELKSLTDATGRDVDDEWEIQLETLEDELLYDIKQKHDLS